MTTGIIMGLIALVLVVLLISSLTNGGINSGTTIVVNGTIPPQGTAVTSTVPPQQQTVTSSATEVLGFGTTANNCDLIVCQDRVLAAGASETLDLYGGAVITDLAGKASPIRHLKILTIYVVTGTGDVAGLTVGNAASQAFLGPLGGTTPTQTIYPGGVPLQWGEPTVGLVVGAATNNLKILNNSAVSLTYRIIIGGTST